MRSEVEVCKRDGEVWLAPSAEGSVAAMSSLSKTG